MHTVHGFVTIMTRHTSDRQHDPMKTTRGLVGGAKREGSHLCGPGSGSLPTLHCSDSLPTLHCSDSLPTLHCSDSLPTLHCSDSLPTLHCSDSLPTLHCSDSLPTLHCSDSLPTLHCTALQVAMVQYIVLAGFLMYVHLLVEIRQKEMEVSTKCPVALAVVFTCESRKEGS